MVAVALSVATESALNSITSFQWPRVVLQQSGISSYFARVATEKKAGESEVSRIESNRNELVGTRRVGASALKLPPHQIIVLNRMYARLGYFTHDESLQSLVFGTVNLVKAHRTFATELVHHVGVQRRV